MAHFFIDRPIFAWVIAIVVMLAGLLAIRALPVEQYPTIAPPSISVTATYPGASASVLQDSVTQVIEQQMTGLDGLLYMTSTSEATGSATVTLTFSADTDPDIAQVQVQNKLQAATARLPEAVQRQGLIVDKASRSFLMVIALTSEDGQMNRTDLADYIATNLEDPLARIEGVGSVRLFGATYAMRIWLDPYQLANFGITVPEVSAAIQAQNVQVSAGELGGLPQVEGQQLNATVNAQSRLETVEQFEAILLRVNNDGSRVTLADVARVELGAENYSVSTWLNGAPAAGIAIQLAAGANALDTAEAVRARMDELAAYFPAGLAWTVNYDTTPFVEASIGEVIKTLFEAIALVFCVMYLFLQNFRATLIPTIAVPVVLLGTFGVLAATGYSINTLTMFAMVLAIGLLVDDAIVVVENVERVMSEEGLGPREATRKSMTQITGALVGIALVLSAVFVPMAFFGGATGAIYRQFSVTIVSAMVLSVFVALILTPALCATLLKPIQGEHGAKRGFFGWFNRAYDRGNRRYLGLVDAIVHRRVAPLLVYAALVALLAWSFLSLPTSFFPEEDQGVMMVQVQLPVGATADRTEAVLEKIAAHLNANEAEVVETVFTISGFSFSGAGQNMGLAFVRLKDWEARDGDVAALVRRSNAAFSQLRDAFVIAIVPPAVRDLGNSSGFNLYLQDRGGAGHDALLAARNQILGAAAQDPRLTQVRPNGLEDRPQYQIDIDADKARALGVSLSDINTTLSTAWGGSYINDFIDKNRIKRVYLQGDAPFRMEPDDLDAWYVANADGELVAFSSFASGRWTYGSPRLERFNGVPAVNLTGEAAAGYSSGEAMAAIAEIVDQVPGGFGFEWAGLSYQEQLSGEQGPALYVLSILVVFLCLAALYESWSIPFAVLLAMPLGVLGAVIATSLRGLQGDIFFQVGLLTTIGLSAKNAILIVEFAKDLHAEGRTVIEATLEAARQRLRPILMTSLAFMLGVLPLALASGPGAGGQNSIGTGVLGGMLSALVLVIVFVPLFFVLITRRGRRVDAGGP